MEEKIKKIILPIIAILIGIIIGGCTKVNAERIPITYIGTSVGLYEGSEGNTSFCWLRENQVNKNCVWNNGMYRYWTISLTPQTFQQGVYYNLKFIIQIEYKSKNKNVYWKDMQMCYNSKCVVGTITESIYDKTEKDSVGYYTTRSYLLIETYYEMGAIESGITYFNLQFKTENTIEMIEATVYQTPYFTTLTGQDAQIEANRQDTQAQINAQKEQFDKLINSGNFNKPNKDTALEDLEEDESLLQDILGIPNYNDLNIEINESATDVIWDLIIRVLNQNTAILTMIITILSISILKLIMNR